MNTNGRARAGLMGCLGLLLAACGGGGGAGGTPSSGTATSLSATQQVAQDGYMQGVYGVGGGLPTTGMPTSGASSLYATRYAISAPLSASPQIITETTASLSANLALPSFLSTSVSRALVNGRIYSYGTSLTVQDRLWLQGDGVVSDSLATDGTTVLPGVLYTSYESIPLTGAMTAAPLEVRTWPVLAAFSSNTALLKAGATFAAGSAYLKRQGVRRGDAVFLTDCNGATTTPTPSPCANASTVEGALPLTINGVTYTVTDGTVQTLQGLRAWISTTPAPTSYSPTTAYLVAVELNGAVYHGILQRDGAVIRTRLLDGTLVDYTLRFNQQALDSLKAALTF
jgi:hypothetical protein